MEEEEEICRVCRSEATLEQPLFHPCKCSGSIRHVHQDCLIEWLSHSRKKYCELCEHPFTFTPVYRQDMPEVLPATLFFAQIKKKVTAAISLILRAILVSFIWLVLLPYFTIWVWRFYFFLGSNLSRYLSKLQHMKHQLELSKNLTTVFNMTYNNTNHIASSNWFHEYTFHSFLADCFEGQIITCIVVIIFVAVFLLREWIVQNIPMDNPVVEEEPQQNNIVPSDEFDPTPPSPVALHEHLDYDEPSTSTSRTTRATSMPPSSSFHSSDHENDIADRRSSSMEPYTPHTNESHHHGYPPNAPRMRHAEPPVPVIPEHVDPPPHREHQIINNQEEEEDDDDENIEEFEGVLEAIGMQGSLWSLAQNCALMALLIALSLGAAVWMPYLIGVLFIMSETFDLIRIPLKLARFITDPVVDYLALICTDRFIPWIMGIYHLHIEPTFLQLPPLFQYTTTPLFHFSKQHTIAKGATPDLLTSISNFIHAAEPYVDSAFRRYQGLATGHTAMDRFACISVGYTIVTIVSCWYLTRSANNNMAVAAFGRTAQEALRHQGIIFKVGMFITIELVIFPIVCGFLLDVTALPLFKAATLVTRATYLWEHPMPSVFLHWFLGTGFMFLFAVLVTLCRESVRPGVMWFIRDPNDPQFHPIREIVEKPIFFQFKKIGASALIYMTVILLGVGGVVHTVDYLIPTVLPLRWDLSHSLSVVPIDLIVVQVGLPAIINFVNPKQKLKQLFVTWMMFTCRQLRLTSFIFGGRHPEEEGHIVYHTWSAWVRRAAPTQYPSEGVIENVIGPDVSYVWNGQLLRVPRHDSVPIIEARRMLVPLDSYTLEPIDLLERRQGHPAATAPGGDEANTVVVYSPPAFKHRVLFFVGFMWLSIILFTCTVTILPLLLGRRLFDVTDVGDHIHDIYAFAAGWLVILFLSVLANQLVTFADDVLSQSSVYGTVQSTWIHMKQWTSWIIRWVFFITSFGFIVPVSLGMLIELYFAIPLQPVNEEGLSITVLPMWVYGFASMVLIHGIIQTVPNNDVRAMITDIFQNGIHQMKLGECTKKLVGPPVLISLTAACLPFTAGYVHMQLFPQNNRELRIKLLQMMYPGSLIGITAYFLGKLGSKVTSQLAQSIREDNYLVGKTLHNLEQ